MTSYPPRSEAPSWRAFEGQARSRNSPSATSATHSGTAFAFTAEISPAPLTSFFLPAGRSSSCTGAGGTGTAAAPGDARRSRGLNIGYRSSPETSRATRKIAGRYGNWDGQCS